MGDALPLLSLGTGKVAVAPSPTPEITLPPTPAPTVPATPAPTVKASAPVRGVWYFVLAQCRIQMRLITYEGGARVAVRTTRQVTGLDCLVAGSRCCLV